MTGRRVVQLLVLAALVPAGWFGAVHWRDASDPAAAATLRAHAGRPQIGRAVSAAAGPAQVETEPSWHGAPTGVGKLRQLNAGRTADAVREADATVDPAMPPSAPSQLARAEPQTEDRRVRPAPAGPPLGSSVPPAGMVAVTSPLAVVELTAVAQDLSLLQGSAFTADTVRELGIAVKWSIAGVHAQRLELFSPTGALYRRFTADFDGDVPGGAGVETRLPVGGTWITEYSLFGTWRVDVYLDNEPTPTTSVFFVLNR